MSNKFITYAADTTKGFDVYVSGGDVSPIKLHSIHGGENQQFTMQADGSIKVLGKCVDVTGNSSESGTKLISYACNSSGAQKFEYDTTSKRIKHISSGKCLDLPGGGVQNGNDIIIYPCHDGVNQKWNVNSLVASTTAAPAPTTTRTATTTSAPTTTTRSPTTASTATTSSPTTTAAVAEAFPVWGIILIVVGIIILFSSSSVSAYMATRKRR